MTNENQTCVTTANFLSLCASDKDLDLKFAISMENDNVLHLMEIIPAYVRMIDEAADRFALATSPILRDSYAREANYCKTLLHSAKIRLNARLAKVAGLIIKSL